MASAVGVPAVAFELPIEARPRAPSLVEHYLQRSCLRSLRAATNTTCRCRMARINRRGITFQVFFACVKLQRLCERHTSFDHRSLPRGHLPLSFPTCHLGDVLDTLLVNRGASLQAPLSATWPSSLKFSHLQPVGCACYALIKPWRLFQAPFFATWASSLKFSHFPLVRCACFAVIRPRRLFQVAARLLPVALSAPQRNSVLVNPRFAAVLSERARQEPRVWTGVFVQQA